MRLAVPVESLDFEEYVQHYLRSKGYRWKSEIVLNKTLVKPIVYYYRDHGKYYLSINREQKALGVVLSVNTKLEDYSIVPFAKLFKILEDDN